MVSDLVVISKESLTPAQGSDLADFPQYDKWHADITGEKTRRYYRRGVAELWLAKIPSGTIALRFLSFRQTMRVLLEVLFRLIRACFRTRTELALENLALRQQLQVLNRRHPKPRMTLPNRFFWVILRQLWAGWKHAPIIVEPQAVDQLQQARFVASQLRCRGRALR